MMIRSCGDEEEITSLECFALTFVKQYAPTPDDDVDLVLYVRGSAGSGAAAQKG